MTTPDETGEPLAADFAAWDFWRLASPAQAAAQHRRLAALRFRGYAVGEGCVVSSSAAVHPESLVLGDRSYVAAHAHVTGERRRPPGLHERPRAAQAHQHAVPRHRPAAQAVRAGRTRGVPERERPGRLEHPSRLRHRPRS